MNYDNNIFWNIIHIQLEYILVWVWELRFFSGTKQNYPNRNDLMNIPSFKMSENILKMHQGIIFMYWLIFKP